MVAASNLLHYPFVVAFAQARARFKAHQQMKSVDNPELTAADKVLLQAGSGTRGRAMRGGQSPSTSSGASSGGSFTASNNMSKGMTASAKTEEAQLADASAKKAGAAVSAAEEKASARLKAKRERRGSADSSIDGSVDGTIDEDDARAPAHASGGATALSMDSVDSEVDALQGEERVKRPSTTAPQASAQNARGRERQNSNGSTVPARGRSASADAESPSRPSATSATEGEDKERLQQKRQDDYEFNEVRQPGMSWSCEMRF